MQRYFIRLDIVPTTVLAIALAFTLVFTLVFTISPAQAGLDKDAVKVTTKDFNTSFRTVRAEFFDFPAYSLKVADADYVCHIPQALRRLALTGESFRVRKVHTKRDHFRVELETQGKRRLTIRVFDRGGLQQEFLEAGFVRLLSDIFEYGDPPVPLAFVGHTESRLLHINKCNHLPTVALREEFDDQATAAAAGYRNCPICFESTEVLPYPNFLAHRAMGLQGARMFELVYPPAENVVLQAQLDDIGATVLAHWPLELAGFEYDFRVVQAAQPLAVSFRTGIILVSDTMLEAAETEEELLFLVAHEVAHCELHLPPRAPYGMGRRYDPLSSEYTAFGTWAENLQLAADLIAVAWFQTAPPGRWELGRARGVLLKVQHAAGGTDQLLSEAGQEFGMHERLWLFEPSRFIPGDPSRVYGSVDGEDDIRYEVRLLGLFKDNEAKATVPYFLLTTTDYQEKGFVVNSLGKTGGIIRDVNGKGAEFTVRPYLAAPGFSTLVIGKTSFGDLFKDYTPGPLRTLELWDLQGNKDWIVVGEESGS